MGSRDTFVIERAKISQLPEFLEFMYNNYDKDENVLRSLIANNPVTLEEKKQMRLDHERLLRAIFKDLLCLIATDRTSGKMIGTLLMIQNKNPRFYDDVRDVFEENPPKTKLMKDYYDYFNGILKMANLFEKFPKAKVALEFYAVAVDKNYRNKGIANALMAEGVAFAKEVDDVGFAFGISTSRYTKRATDKCGFRTQYEVDLLQYKDSEGTPIFEGTEPHNIVSVVAVKLE